MNYKFDMIRLTILLLIFLFFTRCRKDNFEKHQRSINTLEDLKKPVMESFTVDSRSYPVASSPRSGIKTRSSNKLVGGSLHNKLMGSAYKYGPEKIIQEKDILDPDRDLLFLHQKYKSQMFTIADQSMALHIYPGAILDGRSIQGDFDPKMLQGISSNIRPITVSTSMPVSSAVLAKTSLPRPISGIELTNAALASLEKLSPNGVGAASLQIEIDSFTVYEELKTLYGFNKGIDAFLYNAKTKKHKGNHMITARSALKVKFF